MVAAPSSSHTIDARSIVHARIISGKNVIDCPCVNPNAYDNTLITFISRITITTTAEMRGTIRRFMFVRSARAPSPTLRIRRKAINPVSSPVSRNASAISTGMNVPIDCSPTMLRTITIRSTASGSSARRLNTFCSEIGSS